MNEFLMSNILWFKAFHVIFMVAWFAGIFYLPRLFVNHAETSSVEVSEQLKGMERRLLYFITPFAILTVLLGLLLIFAYGNAWFVAAKWLHIKLTLVILLLMRIHQKKPIKLMSMIGVLLGIIGIYLLISQKQVMDQENSLLGAFMIFLCMLSWAYGSLFVAKADLPSNFFINTGYQMFIGGCFLCIASVAFGESWTFPGVWSTDVKISMLLLVVFGSIVAFTSFNYLLKIVSPEKVATSTYVNPIVALILGWFILNERITMQSCIAAMILLTGVYFINTKKTLTVFKRFKK